MRGRLYDPELAQFLQADRALANPKDQSLNRFAYVNNSPVNFVDPTGMSPFGDALVFLAGRIGETWLTTFAGTELARLRGSSFSKTPDERAFHGGLNGLFTGWRGIYDWESPEGYAAFVADSTIGIDGTALGNYMNIVNTFFWPVLAKAVPSAGQVGYRPSLSENQNRQVFEGGSHFLFVRPQNAFTQGNVISNLGRHGRDPGATSRGLLAHETEHITTNRLFGDFYLGTYVGWTATYTLLAGILELSAEDGRSFDRVVARGYYSNPWEQHAYCHNPGGWPDDPNEKDYMGSGTAFCQTE